MKRLKELRELFGLTRERPAKGLDISPHAIALREDEKHKPTKLLFDKLPRFCA